MIELKAAQMDSDSAILYAVAAVTKASKQTIFRYRKIYCFPEKVGMHITFSLVHIAYRLNVFVVASDDSGGLFVV